MWFHLALFFDDHELGLACTCVAAATLLIQVLGLWAKVARVWGAGMWFHLALFFDDHELGLACTCVAAATLLIQVLGFMG